MADSLFGRGSLDVRLSLTNGCRPGRGFGLGGGAGTGRSSAGLGGLGRICHLRSIGTGDRCRGSSRGSLSWSSCTRRRCHGVCGHTSVRGWSTVVRVAAAPVATAAAIPTIAAAATIIVAAAPAAAPAVPGLGLLCIRKQGDSHHRKERSNSNQKRTTHVAPPWNKRLYVLFPPNVGRPPRPATLATYALSLHLPGRGVVTQSWR